MKIAIEIWTHLFGGIGWQLKFCPLILKMQLYTVADSVFSYDQF